MLLGFAIGFTEAFEEYCPQYRLKTEEEIYRSGVIWGEFQEQGEAGAYPDVLTAVIAQYALDPGRIEIARAYGRTTAERYGKDGCGTASSAHRLAANAARLAAGMRAAHGGPSEVTLVDEVTAPVSTAHMYDDGHRMMYAPRVDATLKGHYDLASRVGLVVLTCLYDEDPRSEDYVKQFYWGVGFAKLLDPGGAISWWVLPQFQRQLLEAGAPEGAVHPFLRLGSARVECPEIPDPALPTALSAKPRQAVLRDPVPSGSEVTPQIIKGGLFVEYRYGQVPEDFVPPIPAWKEPCCDAIVMEKGGEGKLVGVDRLVNPLGLPLGPEFNPFELPPLVEEDFALAAGWEEQNGEGVRVGEPHHYLVCKYTAERTGAVRAYSYWHLDRPPWATPEYLKSRHQDHPMLRLGSPIEMCPATMADAARLMP